MSLLLLFQSQGNSYVSTTSVSAAGSIAYADALVAVRATPASAAVTRLGALASVRSAIAAGITSIADALAAVWTALSSAVVTLPPQAHVSIVVFDVPAPIALSVDLEFPVPFSLSANTIPAPMSSIVVMLPVAWEAHDL